MDELIKMFTDNGVSEGVAIAYIVVSVLIVIMAIVALVLRIIVAIRYFKGNRTPISSNQDSFSVARDMLNRIGLDYVNVKRAGFFRTIFFGNSYSPRKKTIYLRRNISERNSLTAVSVAIQKVGLANLCENGNATAIARSRFEVLNLVGPILFVPVVLLGFIVDLIIFQTIGTFSIVSIVVGTLFVLSGFISTLLTLPVEGMANKKALELIEETGILNEEETAIVKKIYSAYIMAYLADFIIAILRIVQIILEIIIKMQMNKNRN